MAASLGVWGHLAAARVRSDWQYRTSFLLLLLSQVLIASCDLAVVATLFSHVRALGGWSGLEVALIFGFGGVAFGLADLFIGQLDKVSRHIKAGTFDLLLVRPVPTLLHLSGSEVSFRRVARCLQPLVVLAVALVVLDVDWNPEKVLLVPVAVVSGAVIFGGIFVITSSIAFWTVESREVGNAFTYGGDLVVQYPLDVFGSWLRRLATLVVPLAFVAYLPAAHLLDRANALGLPSLAAWASPVVALLVALVARAVWTTAIRHHRSTGS